MADILSQDEVDALLSAVSSGELPEVEQPQESAGGSVRQKQMTLYDFKRPEMISKDQVRTLQMVHENFARYLSNFMSAYLRTVVEIDLIAVDQLTYGEFIMSLPNPTNMTIINMSPLEGKGIFEINPVLVFSIVDRLLGGPGAPPPEIRLFTDIEQKIIGSVVDKALEGLTEAWEHVAHVDFSRVDTEMNPQFCQILAANETVAAMTLEVAIGETSGIISICIPYISLEPLIDKLSAQHMIGVTPKKVSGEKRERLEKNLSMAPVNVSFAVGSTQLTIQEISNLHVGDVVVLDRSAKDLIDLCIEGIPKFAGLPGLLGAKKGFIVKKQI
ncbi:flagellar motor switch protein FliM [bacterium]|nr:flagellar motor switch protein FliM [bacterium]